MAHRTLIAVLSLVLGTTGLVRSAEARLVLHLKLDDGIGTVATDSSGLGHDGTLYNMDPNSDWVPGMAGTALDFDGIDDHVLVPDHPDFSFSTSPIGGDFTVSAWVFKRATSAGGDNRFAVSVWNLGDLTPGDNEWALLLGDPNGADLAGLRVDLGVNGLIPSIYAGEISLATWHHVAGVRGSGGNVTIYVDGQFAAWNTSFVGRPVLDTGRDIALATNLGSTQVFLDALIDDVQIYDERLLPAAIRFLFENPGLTHDDFLSLGAVPGLPIGIGAVVAGGVFVGTALALLGRTR